MVQYPLENTLKFVPFVCHFLFEIKMANKLTREELIELVDKIVEAIGPEEEINANIDILEQHVPHPEVSELIFHPDEEMSSEEIVDAALNYKPIRL